MSEHCDRLIKHCERLLAALSYKPEEDKSIEPVILSLINDYATGYGCQECPRNVATWIDKGLALGYTSCGETGLQRPIPVGSYVPTSEHEFNQLAQRHIYPRDWDNELVRKEMLRWNEAAFNYSPTHDGIKFILCILEDPNLNAEEATCKVMNVFTQMTGIATTSGSKERELKLIDRLIELYVNDSVLSNEKLRFAIVDFLEEISGLEFSELFASKYDRIHHDISRLSDESGKLIYQHFIVNESNVRKMFDFVTKDVDDPEDEHSIRISLDEYVKSRAKYHRELQEIRFLLETSSAMPTVLMRMVGSYLPWYDKIPLSEYHRGYLDGRNGKPLNPQNKSHRSNKRRKIDVSQ